jgi:WD40 repeat protein
MENAR